MGAIRFLTSNKKKAEDFATFGFEIMEFDKEIPEVLSPDVETVALHKARMTGLTNIAVEDTSLHVEGAGFFGTQIKHVYDEVKDSEEYDGRMALWKIAICMKRDGKFYVASGELEGTLRYPALDYGYHFDRIFAVRSKDGSEKRFEDLSEDEKTEIGPRFVAARKMALAIESGDFSNLKEIDERDVKDWSGGFQEEACSNDRRRKKGL